MTKNLTPAFKSDIFGFTPAEFAALERVEISDERGDKLAEFFCDDEGETYNKYVEDCGGL